MPSGESPHECAVRETFEEVGLEIADSAFDLRCILSEKDYEETGHWLMFVFAVSVRLKQLPEAIDEGEFGFFEMGELDELDIPELDKRILREHVLNEGRSGVVSLRVNEGGGRDAEKLVVEESYLGQAT